MFTGREKLGVNGAEYLEAGTIAPDVAWDIDATMSLTLALCVYTGVVNDELGLESLFDIILGGIFPLIDAAFLMSPSDGLSFSSLYDSIAAETSFANKPTG